jgi:hypothetical protein
VLRRAEEMHALKLLTALVAFASAAGCTHEQTLAGPVSVAGLQRSVPEQGLEIEGYGKIPPTATVSISLVSGGTVTLLAEQICRGPEGLFQRPEGYSICSRAVFVAGWSDIREVTVEELDRLSTTLVVAGSVLIVAGAVMMASSGSKSPTKAEPPKRHTPASPRVNSSATAQALPPVSARPGAEEPSGYDHNNRGGSAVYIGLPLFGNSSGGASSSGSAQAPPQEGIAVASDARADLTPLYSSARERRASLAPFVRAGADVCATGTCSSFAARAGARFGNLFELSGGVLVDRDAQALKPMGLLSAGFHGGPPGVQWVALYVGTNAATDGSTYRISPEAGVRFELTEAISLGILPAAFAYRSREKRFNYTPAIDLGILF